MSSPPLVGASTRFAPTNWISCACLPRMRLTVSATAASQRSPAAAGTGCAAATRHQPSPTNTRAAANRCWVAMTSLLATALHRPKHRATHVPGAVLLANVVQCRRRRVGELAGTRLVLRRRRRLALAPIVDRQLVARDTVAEGRRILHPAFIAVRVALDLAMAARID